MLPLILFSASRNIEFTLEGATLLGPVRENKLIGFDWDNDITLINRSIHACLYG